VSAPDSAGAAFARVELPEPLEVAVGAEHEVRLAT
jgi:hypothetical protein